jgi:hypothetical protein
MTVQLMEPALTERRYSFLALDQEQCDGTILATEFFGRGGRAVECAGLENRKAERPREFESHPLRQPSLGAKWKAKAATPE